MKKTLMMAALLGALAAPASATQYHRGVHEGPVLHADTMPIGHPGAPVLIERTIRVTMLDVADDIMAFDPPSIDIAEGETIRLALSNEGSVPHDFVMATPEEIADHRADMAGVDDMIHEAGYAARVEPAGDRALIWTFANAGEFEFACLIPGHYEAGMHGRLTVK
jgi:uncharacterized cupredoxin-like copper-binding protein